MNTMSFSELRSGKTGSGSKVTFLKENKIISLTIVIWNCQASYKNEYAGLLVLHLLLLMNLWLIVKMWSFLQVLLWQMFFRAGSTGSLPFSRGRSTHYSDRLHDFPVTILRCYKGVYVNSFLPCLARLWNSLPVECFPLTYDFSGFKSRINRYLLTVGYF